MLITGIAATSAASANTVSFNWVSTSGGTSVGSVSISSSLITGSTFNVTIPQLTTAGQTAIGDISAFSFTFSNGQSLTNLNSTFANSTGWSDDAAGHLTSTWTASRSVTGNPNGTLSVASVPWNGTSQASSVLTNGTIVDYGYWQLAAPVPLPAAFWLLGSGLTGLVAAGRRRRAVPAAA